MCLKSYMLNIYGTGSLQSMETWFLRGMLFRNREVGVCFLSLCKLFIFLLWSFGSWQAAMEMASYPQAAAHLNKQAVNHVCCGPHPTHTWGPEPDCWCTRQWPVSVTSVFPVLHLPWRKALRLHLCRLFKTMNLVSVRSCILKSLWAWDSCLARGEALDKLAHALMREGLW